MFHGWIPPERFLPYLTSQDIAALPCKADAVVLQPLGATEQHGPHLPLAVDTVIVQGVLGAALAKLDPAIPCFVLPPLCYGKSNEHADFAGTITLTARTLLQTLEEVADSLHASGFRKLALVNGHGGQPQVVQIAARDARAKHRDLTVFPLFIWSVPSSIDTLFPARERDYGIHAGAAETALMLALLPDTVRMERARAEWPRNLPGANAGVPGAPAGVPGAAGGSLLSMDGPRPFAWLTRDLSSSGVLGDPTTATAATGATLLASLADGWAALLGELYRFRLPDAV